MAITKISDSKVDPSKFDSDVFHSSNYISGEADSKVKTGRSEYKVPSEYDSKPMTAYISGSKAEGSKASGVSTGYASGDMSSSAKTERSNYLVEAGALDKNKMGSNYKTIRSGFKAEAGALSKLECRLSFCGEDDLIV